MIHSSGTVESRSKMDPLCKSREMFKNEIFSHKFLTDFKKNLLVLIHKSIVVAEFKLTTLVKFGFRKQYRKVILAKDHIDGIQGILVAGSDLESKIIEENPCKTKTNLEVSDMFVKSEKSNLSLSVDSLKPNIVTIDASIENIRNCSSNQAKIDQFLSTVSMWWIGD